MIICFNTFHYKVSLTYCFLYTTGDNDYDYLNDIADVLAESEEGVVRMVSSEYGYNVVMKYPFPADVDATNLANGQKTAWQMLALAIGLCLIYPLDRHWIKFETKAVWWAQILKLAIGVGLVLAVRVGLKAPLNALFGTNVGAAVRYFFIVVVAGILWPLTFRFWSKLGKKKENEK